MPRIPRMLVTDQPAIYHVISRTALQGLPITDTDKDRDIGPGHSGHSGHRDRRNHLTNFTFFLTSPSI